MYVEYTNIKLVCIASPTQLYTCPHHLHILVLDLPLSLLGPAPSSVNSASSSSSFCVADISFMDIQKHVQGSRNPVDSPLKVDRADPVHIMGPLVRANIVINRILDFLSSDV
jgi:hypothetical protein